MRRVSYLENAGNHEPERARHPAHRSHQCRPWGFHSRPGAFFGVDTGNMGPKAQIVFALSVLAPVLLSGVLLVALVPSLWWIFTTYGWVSFPAFGLLAHGLTGLNSAPPAEQRASITAESKERELLRALAEHGELSPLQAAIETSLTVSEADEKLKELAEGGHLEVRVRGGGLFYSLWDSGAGPWRIELE